MRLKKMLGAGAAACGGAVLVWVACGPQTVASRYVKLVQVSALEGAIITVDSSDSPDLAGTSLVIPPGSLAQDTVITLELSRNPLSAQGVGPVAVWGPFDAPIQTPVQMTIPFSLQSADSGELTVVAFASNALDPNEVSIDTLTGRANFPVMRLSEFQVARDSADGGSLDDGGIGDGGDNGNDGGDGGFDGFDGGFDGGGGGDGGLPDGG